MTTGCTPPRGPGTLSVVIYLLLCSFTQCLVFGGFRSMGKIDSEGNIYNEGEDINMNCTISDTYEGPCNATNLYFKLGGNSTGSKYITILSDRSINFRWPHQPASVKHYFFTCQLYCDGHTELIDMKTVKIGRSPIVPHNITCRMVHLETLECTWQPSSQKEYTIFPTTMQLQWTHTIQHRERQWSKCPRTESSNTCVWDLANQRIDYGDTLLMTVSAANILGNVTSETIEINTTTIGHPKSLEKNAVKITNLGSRSAILEWNAPDYHHLLTYQITLISPREDYFQREVEGRESVVFQDLHPYTEYVYDIKMMPRVGGFWSDSTQGTFTTLPAAPRSAPQVNIGSYTTSNNCQPDCTIITVYWKKLPRHHYNGPGVRYEVNMTTKPGCLVASDDTMVTKIVDGNTTHTQFTLRSYCRAVFTVNSVNNQGHAPYQPQPIIVDLQKTAVIPTFDVTALSDRQVQVFYRLPYSTLHPPSTLSVYWCKGNKLQPQCQNALNWETVDITDLQNVTIPFTLDGHYVDYIFAISVGSNISSSGMVWSSCTHDMRNAPPQARLGLTQPQQHGMVSVEWALSPCDTKAPVTGFIILFCPVHNCAQNETLHCKDIGESFYEIADQRSAEYHHVLERQVLPDKHYRVQVITRGSSKNSHRSNAVCWQVTSHWLSTPAMIGIVVGAVLGFILVIVGVISLVRKCKRIHKWFHSEPITLPEKPTSVSSQRPLMRDGSVVSNESWGYDKHLSMSGDSGHGSISDQVRTLYQGKPCMSLLSEFSSDEVFVEDNLMVVKSDLGYMKVNTIPEADMHKYSPSPCRNPSPPKVVSPGDYTVHNPGYGLL